MFQVLCGCIVYGFTSAVHVHVVMRTDYLSPSVYIVYVMCTRVYLYCTCIVSTRLELTHMGPECNNCEASHYCNIYPLDTDLIV